MKFISAVLILTLVASPASVKAQAGNNSPLTPWCILNPAQHIVGQTDQIEADKIHIVLGAKQAEAKARLLNGVFFKINRDEASQLVGKPSGVTPGANYYLVRASAFYVDQDYNIKSGLAAYLYPREKVLEIVNSSLSQSGTVPADLAIVVETNVAILKAEITCLTAQ